MEGKDGPSVHRSISSPDTELAIVGRGSADGSVREELEQPGLHRVKRDLFKCFGFGTDTLSLRQHNSADSLV